VSRSYGDLQSAQCGSVRLNSPEFVAKITARGGLANNGRSGAPVGLYV
jgi:hypothetical protein